MTKFRVTGSNKDTSARMTLELVAASRGDAERKATQSGMIVSHVAPVNENTVEESKTPMAMKNYRDEGPASNTKKLLYVLIGLAVLAALLHFVIFPWLVPSA